MAHQALKKLTIEHFRGATRPFTLTFDPKKSLTIVYGENGTGKSTICDAFDLLGNDQVGSLLNRGLGKTNSYWHSVGTSAKDVVVTLETAQSVCRATLARGSASVQPAHARPRVQVLRRTQILSLLETTAGKRYEAISAFIDVSGVEESEATLGKTIALVKSESETAQTRVQENREAIHQFWTQEGRPAPNALVWAEKQVQRDTDAFDLEVDALGYLQRTFERLLDYPVKLKNAQAVLDSAQAASTQAQIALEQAITRTTHDSADLVELLEAAHAHLAGHAQPTACPLCGSAERVTGLADRVQARLDAFETLRQTQANARTRALSAHNATQQLNAIVQMAQQHAADLQTARSNAALPPQTPLPQTPLPADPLQWEAWLHGHMHLLDKWKKAETDRLDQKRFLGTLQLALNTLNENMVTLQELEGLVPRLERALEIVRAERRKFTDAMLTKIAAEVGRLYEMIHPGEGLDKITLELDPKKRASLEIATNFGQATGTPPQAYFSESHLDTLGLCVFMVLAKQNAPGDTILVLDDILASVDEPHVDRVIEMLYAESANYAHCVITTHYRAWKEKFRWGDLQNGSCHFVELQKWHHSKGMLAANSIPEIERLRKLLSETPPDYQSISGKAGVLLECVLDFMTLRYACAVPRKEHGDYTLGDLLPNIDKDLRKALYVEVLTADDNGMSVYVRHELKDRLDALHRMIQVRNIFGAHFNALANHLPETDALEFGQRVLEFAELVMDPDKGFPRKNKTGGYWHTSGETRRLYPVKRPE